MTAPDANERFTRWTERLAAVVAMPPGPGRSAAWDAALERMHAEDTTLAVLGDIRAAGDPVLLRVVHPALSAPAIVALFRELIPAHTTHRAVLSAAR